VLKNKGRFGCEYCQTVNRRLKSRLKVTIWRLVVNIFDRVIDNADEDKKSTKSINVFTKGRRRSKREGILEMGKIKRVSKWMAAVIAAVMIMIPFSEAFVAYAAYEPNCEVHAEAAYMVCLDTGDVVYEKNADKKMAPASLVTIMTAILALEKVEDITTETNTLKRSIQDHLYLIGNVALGGVVLNEELTIEQMLYAMMLRSANECAMMIADYVGDGSQAYFVDMMNQKAMELGATNTNFVNANGLDEEDQYTTAKDVFLMAKYALGVEGFREIVETVTYDTGATNKHTNLKWQTNMQMINPSSQYYYGPVTGIKSGNTADAGRCFVSVATMNGYTYLLVVMGAPTTDEDGNAYEKNLAFVDTKALYNWAFNTFEIKTIVEEGRQITEEPVKMSLENDYVMLVTGGGFEYLLPANLDMSSIIFDYSSLPEYIEAPVKKGDVIGELKFILADEELGSVPLIAAKDIAKSEMLGTLQSIKEIFASFWFKFGVVLFVLIIVFYIVFMIIRNKNKREYSNVRRRKRL